MKLTKLQRYTAYVIMLAELDKSFKKHGAFLCHLIHDVFGFNNSGIGDQPFDMVIDSWFPELEIERIRNAGWIDHERDGLEERRKSIEWCIKEISPD